MVYKILNRVLSKIEYNDKNKPIIFLLIIDLALIIALFSIKFSTYEKDEKTIDISFVESIPPENENQNTKTTDVDITHIPSNLDEKLELKELRKNIKSIDKFKQDLKDQNIDIFSDSALNNSDKDENTTSQDTYYDDKEEEKTYSDKSTISYYLKNRYSTFMPNPVYKCKNKGIVHVDIYVNRKGDVVESNVNKQKTNISNECLFDIALEYSKRAKFNFDSKNDIQKGSIIYYFQ